MATRESLVPALAASIAGLLGVVVGAFVAGHYQLESQRISVGQARDAAQYETSRVAAQSLLKAASDYLAQLSYLATVAKTPDNVANLDQRMQALYHSAFELSLQTTLPTAAKIFDANVYVSEVMAAAREPDKLKALESKSKLLGEVYLAIYTDVARFRVTSGPTMGRDELLTSLVQLLTQGEAKPK